MDSDQNRDDDHRTRQTEMVDDDGNDRSMRVATSDAVHRPDDAHLSDAEVARLRTMLHDDAFDNGSSRVKWFLLGFLAALVSLVVAAAVFLVVSDDDNDGRINVEVPTVDVDG